jgi:hypothetical protein
MLVCVSTDAMLCFFFLCYLCSSPSVFIVGAFVTVLVPNPLHKSSGFEGTAASSRRRQHSCGGRGYSLLV